MWSRWNSKSLDAACALNQCTGISRSIKGLFGLLRVTERNRSRGSAPGLAAQPKMIAQRGVLS